MDGNLLNDLLLCRHCLDFLDLSCKMLPCTHTFCKNCLDNIIDTVNELRCPMCDMVFENLVDELPPNILVIQILNAVKTQNITVDSPKQFLSIACSDKTPVKEARRIKSRSCPRNMTAQVLFNYLSKEPGHLNLKKGDNVVLYQKVNFNWYLGEKDGTVGLIPQSCVQVFKVKLNIISDLSINGKVINQYMDLIAQRSSDTMYIFNTAFYSTLKTKGYARASCWTDNVDIFSKKKLFVPIHLEADNHWCLTCVDFQKKSIDYYDSLKFKHCSCLKRILKYLMKEHINRKNSEFHPGSWCLHIVRKCPQQENPFDGGFYVCKFVECLSKNDPLNFTQFDMNIFKKQMLSEVKDKCFFFQ